MNAKYRPGTIINWYNQNTYKNEIENVITKPLFLQLFTSDKGPENLRTISGDEFFKLYGNVPSFKRHGQPLIQAAQIIKAGGELFCKRVVANDATLANIIVVAKVSNESTQKFDASGNPIYIDAETGNETVESNNGLNEKAMVNAAKIKFDAVSVKDVKTLAQVKAYGINLLKDEVDAEILTSYDDTTKVGDALTDLNPVGQVVDSDDPDYGMYVYPLFAVVDNGRGVSSKRFNITPDYLINKTVANALYRLNFIGDTREENEYVYFTVQEDVIYSGKNRSLNMIGKDLTQIKTASFEDSTELFINRLCAITGISKDEMNASAVLFGRNKKGEKLDQIMIDEEGYILDSELGIMLQEGTNGSFGDAPFVAETYADEMVKVINGEYDDSIYDVDTFKIDVCVDANYPVAVKNEIDKLAEFREDFVFFKDFGLEVTSMEQIREIHINNARSKFVKEFVQSWDVIDPWSKKQITTTITYSIAPKLVSHLRNHRSAPACGIINGFIFTDAIEGTINMLPKITPTVDQKTELSDMNINYAAYVNGNLTLETAYTSVEETNNQLRYSNNILAITKLIHDIRTECPKFRYSFITDTDLNKYQERVNDIIKNHIINFAEIRMEYVQDEIMAANKIFEASIFVKFKNFAQEEIFNIYTLS